MVNKEKYLGESKLIEQPNKKLKLLIGEKAVKTRHIESKAVVTEKIADDAITNEKLKDGLISWAKLDDNVKNIIASREEGGIALANELGNSKMIGISQWKLTEELNAINYKTNNIADEEDLTMVSVDERPAIQLRDKAYEPEKYSGLGRKYLRKNITYDIKIVHFGGFVENVAVQAIGAAITDGNSSNVVYDRIRKSFLYMEKKDLGTPAKYYDVWTSEEVNYDDYYQSSFTTDYTIRTDVVFMLGDVPYRWDENDQELAVWGDFYEAHSKNILTQAMINEPNTIYHIQYDYDLNGQTITVPEGCTLEFDGGKIYDSVETGKVICNNTLLLGDVQLDCELSGTVKTKYINSSWFKDIHQAADNARNLDCGLRVDKEVSLDKSLNLFNIRYLLIERNIRNTADTVVEIGVSTAVVNGTPNSIEITGRVEYLNLVGGKNLNIRFSACNTFRIIADSTKSGKGSVAYCTITLGIMAHFYIEGVGTGWVNENTFFKGRVTSSFNIIGGDYYHNNNVFYNMTLEGSAGTTTVNFTKCSYNTLYDTRLETMSGSFLKIIFAETTSNNKIYRNWLNDSYSMRRRFEKHYYTNYGESSNGVFYQDDCIIKQWTINRNSYLGNRDLDSVSLYEDNDLIRYEGSKSLAHLKLEVYPVSNFSVLALAYGYKGNSGIIIPSIILFDQNENRINDLTVEGIDWDLDAKSGRKMSRYITANGGIYWLGTDNIYFTQDNRKSIFSFEVRTVSINKRLSDIDAGSENPRVLSKVIITYSCASLRVVFRSIDLRLVQNAIQEESNECCLTLLHKTVGIVSSTAPRSLDTHVVPDITKPNYYILDGERCFCTKNKVEYYRDGDTIKELCEPRTKWKKELTFTEGYIQNNKSKNVVVPMDVKHNLNQAVSYIKEKVHAGDIILIEGVGGNEARLYSTATLPDEEDKCYAISLCTPINEVLDVPIKVVLKITQDCILIVNAYNENTPDYPYRNKAGIAPRVVRYFDDFTEE